jgi:hypothetical protein
LNRQTDLNDLKHIDIEQYEPDQLVDLRSVSIDKSLPVPERMSTFVKQIKNPYLFKVDDITVKVEFSSGKSLEDSLLSFLLTEKSR